MNTDKWERTEKYEYLPISDFWQIFSIAEDKNINTIKREYSKIFEEYNEKYEYITELALVLKYKKNFWHDIDNQKEMLYTDLYTNVINHATTYMGKYELIYFESIVYEK